MGSMDNGSCEQSAEVTTNCGEGSSEDVQNGERAVGLGCKNAMHILGNHPQRLETMRTAEDSGRRGNDDNLEEGSHYGANVGFGRRFSVDDQHADYAAGRVGDGSKPQLNVEGGLGHSGARAETWRRVEVLSDQCERDQRRSDDHSDRGKNRSHKRGLHSESITRQQRGEVHPRGGREVCRESEDQFGRDETVPARYAAGEQDDVDQDDGVTDRCNPQDRHSGSQEDGTHKVGYDGMFTRSASNIQQAFDDTYAGDVFMQGCVQSSSRNSPGGNGGKIRKSDDAHHLLTLAMNGLRPTTTTHADLNDTTQRGMKLHTKEVGRINWISVGGMILDELRDRYEHALECMFSCRILDEAMSSEVVGGKMYTKGWTREAELLQEDVDILIATDHIESIAEGEVKGTVRAFTTVEWEKQRRRFITEPILNYFFEDGGEISLASLEDILTPVNATTHAINLDYPWFFGQMEIPAAARPYYCFKFGGAWWSMKTVATGGRHVPAAAQAITKSIAVLASREVHEHPRNDAYVDNVRFVSSEIETLRAVHQAWVQLSKKAGITIDALGEKFDPTTEYTFLGVRCIHAAVGRKPAVALGDKSSKKLAAWERVLTAPHRERLTMRTVLCVVGVCVWASRVLALSLAKRYYIFKFVRRRVAANHGLDAPAHPWECVIPIMIEWIHEARQKSQRLISESNAEEWTLFSDSCLSGYGAIIIPPPDSLRTQGMTVVAGRWNFDEHINVLEARACKIGVEALPRQSIITPLRIIVDNTAILGSGRKTRSNGFVLNNVVGAIHDSAMHLNYAIHAWKYIGTADNPADAPSRWYEDRRESGRWPRRRCLQDHYHAHVFDEEEIQKVIDKRDLL